MSLPATVCHPLIATTGRVQDSLRCSGSKLAHGVILHACVGFCVRGILRACVLVSRKVRLLRGNVACIDGF